MVGLIHNEINIFSIIFVLTGFYDYILLQNRISKVSNRFFLYTIRTVK